MARYEWLGAASDGGALVVIPCDEGTGNPHEASAGEMTLVGGSAVWVNDGTIGDVLEVGAGYWSAPVALGDGGSYTIGILARHEYDEAFDNIFIGLNDGGDEGFNLQYAGNDSSPSSMDGSLFNVSEFTDVFHSFDPSETTWKLLHLVVDGTDLGLWIDGVQEDLDTAGAAVIVEAVNVLLLGGWNGDPNGGLCGGVTVHATALDSTAIAAELAAWLAAPGGGDPVTIDAEVGGTIEVSTPAARFGVATVPRPDSSYPTPEAAPSWASTHGEPVSVDKTLNGYDRATIRVPIDWAQPDHLEEVEITRNGHRHFLGRMRNTNDNTSAADSVTYSCFGDWHLFTQRYAGTAQRTNYLDNGNFEDADGNADLSGWSDLVNVEAESESTIVLAGKHSVRLTNDQTTWPDLEPSHYDSAFAKNTSPHGSRFYVAAWCYIDGAFLPGYRTFGLRCRYDTGTMQGDVATFIDITHPTNQWTRHYLELPLPPDVVAIVVCELWCPVGTIVWDHVQVVGNTADGAPTPAGGDQAEVAGEFVRAAQLGTGKADLGIARDTPLTGIRSTEMMIHYQHEQVAQKVETMATREEGFDFAVITAGDTKVFRTFFPRRGSDKGTITFPGDVLNYSRTVSGAAAASSIITTGDANDPAREEGAAWDDDALEGLRLEAVVPVPQGTSVGLLNPKAKEYLRQRIEAPQTVDVTLREEDGEGFDPGDTLTFTSDRGNASFSAEYRVVNWRANCPAHTVTLSLIRWIDPDEM